MDWHRGPGGADGVGELLARLVAELGGRPPTGTFTMPSSLELLRATREIEAVCAAEPEEAELLVGFQRAERLVEEARRYQRLAAAGVGVTAFGQGEPRPPVPGVRWVRLGDDRTALCNQWFLVMRRPEPLAMVGFETSTGDGFGRGGLRAPGRTWAGFVGEDARVVDAIGAHLDDVAALAGAGRPSGPADGERPMTDADREPRRDEATGRDPRLDLPGLVAGELGPAEADALLDALGRDDDLRRDLAEVAWAANALRDAASLRLPSPAELPPLELPEAERAEAGEAVLLVATDDGSDPAYRGTRQAALSLARLRRARRVPVRIVLYDRCPELYLVDPYAGPPGATGRVLDEDGARRVGRPYLADQLREARAAGLVAGAWVTEGTGGPALAACLAAVAAREVLLPARLARPPLADRVRGHTLAAFVAALAGLRPTIHLADEHGRLLTS